VKLRPDGAVKVLDFGLAKALQAPESARPGSEPADITSPAMLAMGVLIGTPAYMAPEQARGRAADKRADIWAFGAVLYEMLSGRRAFPGEDLSETLASVLRHEVDWKSLPSSTPAAVRTLIARCLERDPRHRLRDIGEARIVLDSPTASAPPATPGVNARWRLAAFVLLAVVFGLLAGGVALYFNGTRSAPTHVARFSLNLPNNRPLSTNRATLAISADATQIVFAAPSGLYLRSLGEPETKIIRGTEGFSTSLGRPFPRMADSSPSTPEAIRL
jgi:eukaryotic-like serine/threonine-protein kinase